MKHRASKPRVLWVTWEDHRRNKELAPSLGAELHEIIIEQARIVRYLRSLWQTLRLFRSRPDVVICQNPSVLLALVTVLAKPLFRYRAGIDMHNDGIVCHGAVKRTVSRLLQKRADFVIVTNDVLAATVIANGGRPLVVPDKIPAIEDREPCRLAHRNNFLFVCKFAADEPYEELLQAAGQLGPDVGVYVTGNYRNKVDPRDYAPNVHFVGHVPWEEYDSLLRSVDGIIDLTTREDCLVCGAYEAVAAAKPIVLSDTAALRSYFRRGAVFAKNDRGHLREAMANLLERKETLGREVAQLRAELETAWETCRQRVLAECQRAEE